MPRNQRSRKDRKKNKQNQKQNNNSSSSNSSVPKVDEKHASEKHEEAETRETTPNQPEVIQPIVDEPLQESVPDIPAALTGSLVEGQSQLDLLNALEEDDSKDLYEPVAEKQELLKEEPTEYAPIITDEPKSQCEEVQNLKNQDKTEKEEFEARSLEVFEKLFKSPNSAKFNFPVPNSAFNASVLEAGESKLPGISLSHENYFDSRPIFTKSPKVGNALEPVKRGLFLDEFDDNLAHSSESDDIAGTSENNDDQDPAMFESLPDLERESDDEQLQIEDNISHDSTKITEEPSFPLSLEMSPTMREDEENLSDEHRMLTFDTMSESDDDGHSHSPVEDQCNINIQEEFREHTPPSESSDSVSDTGIFPEERNELNLDISDDDDESHENPAPIAVISPYPDSESELSPNLIEFSSNVKEECVPDRPHDQFPAYQLLESQRLQADYENDFNYQDIIADFENNSTVRQSIASASTHSSAIIKHLAKMQINGDGVDLALETRTGERVWIHKFILESLSDYQFSEENCRTVIKTVKCPFDSFTLSMAVEFFYRNRLFLSLENADMYLEISEFFGGIESLEMTILDFLCQSISDETYAEIMEIAEKYNKSNLQELILNKICENVADYQNEILKLSPESFIELLRRDELSVESEEDVVRLVKNWTKEEAPSRTHWLPKILDHVRFSCLQPNFIVTEIASDPIFSGPCSTSIMQAMSYHLLANAKFENPLVKSYPRNSSKNICVVGFSRDNTQISALKGSQWISLDSSIVPASLTSFQTVTVEGFIYIIGGEVQNSATGAKISSTAVYIYDPRLNEIRETTPMTFGRTHFAAVYVTGGKIFVFGGRNSETGILRENEVYDIKTAKWSTIRPLELGRCCHDASVVKSDVVLTGGYVQERSGLSKYTSSVIMFDTICGLWKQVGDLTSPRGWHKSIVFKDEIFVFGGYYQNATKRITVAPLERISLSGSAQRVDLDLIINSSPGIALDDNQVYITGGWDEKWKRFSQICFRVDLETFEVEKLEMRLQNSINFHQTTFVQC